MRAVFAPEALEQVAAVIRAKRWGGTGRGRPQNLRSEPGQLATPRPLEPHPGLRAGPGPGVTLRQPREPSK
jgi:hypothetical protein